MTRLRKTTLTLPCEPPMDWPALLRYFAHRVIPEAEEAVDGCYRRTIRHGGEIGVLQVSFVDGALRAEFWLPSVRAGAAAKARLRDMFDLDADVRAIGAHLSRDPALAPLVGARPHLRIPGGWDPFEIALRTVLGQQVSIAAARLLAARLVERCGADVAGSPFPALCRVFPTPRAVMDADLANMGMPGARVAALKTVAEAYVEQPALFQRAGTTEETVAGLRQIKGVGEWTAQYIALRACRDADAFPAGDVGILRGLADEKGRPGQRQVLERAEGWRPYRAYAAQHVWEGLVGEG